MSQHPTPPAPPATHQPPAATSKATPAGKSDETDPNAGPTEKAAEEARAKGAVAPKAPPPEEPPPPPTYKDANGQDVAVGDAVIIKGVVESVSADDPSHGGNVSVVTDHPINPVSLEKDHFNVRTAVVEGQGPAPGTADAKGGKAKGGQTSASHPTPPPGGSTDPSHASQAQHGETDTPSRKR